MNLQCQGRSDIGSQRKINEDRFAIADMSASVPPAARPAFLLAVADGIGGHEGGEVASALAVETVHAFVSERLKAGTGPSAAVLRDAFHRANEVVSGRSAKTEHLNGMGTTLVAVLTAGPRAAAANVGDSRCYHLREGALRQISRDHSWAAEQERLKILSPKDAAHSPFRNVVTRSIGSAERLVVDIFDLEVREGDALLLCTDGCHGALTDKDILKAFRKHDDPEDICRALVRAAAKAGSRDNITAVAALASK